jgi:hypothetical protein
MPAITTEAAMPTRAKFHCTREIQTRWNAQMTDPQRSYEFQAVYDAHQPEDQRFARATPSGSLTITVDNPNVTFEPGRAYYLEITPADEA